MSRFWYPLIKLPIMDGFQSLRCLWKRLDKMVQYIMLKFVKSQNLFEKRPCNFLKITFANFICNFALSRGKIWLWIFYIFFCVMVLRFYTKNFKSFRAKMKAWRWFSRFQMKSKFGKIAVTPSFLVEMTWNFLCRILEPLRKINYKIAIVKFCL